MKVLVLNAGSCSLKFKLYDMDSSEQVLAEGNCQRVGLETGEIKYIREGCPNITLTPPLPTHQDALKYAIQLLTQGEGAVLSSIHQIGAVGHRLSMGGSRFVQSVEIDDAVIQEISSFREITPLHTPAQVATLEACRKLMGEVPMAAGFDTAFHQTIPLVNQLFPIPYRYYEELGVRRYGFHGLSHQFVAERYWELTKRSPKGHRMVICHLGGGASLTAVQDGASRNNTFGMGTGLGMLSGSRCGTCDTSAVGYIMGKESKTFDQVFELLHRESGLLGISGVSSDAYEVEKAALAGNQRAILALDMMTQQVKQYIGSYAFEMGGLDTILFTGGIGENSDYVRERCCQGLEAFGIRLDALANREHNHSEHCISQPDSPVDIWIIPTNEELLIARDTYRLTGK